MFFKLKKIRKKIAQNRPEIDEKNSYRKQNVFSSLVKCKKKYHPKNTMRLKLSKKAKKNLLANDFSQSHFENREKHEMFLCI